MKRSIRAGRILWLVGLTLFSVALIGCSVTHTTVVMPDAATVKIEQGTPAPYSGWLLTDAAMAALLEMAEQCTRSDP